MVYICVAMNNNTYIVRFELKPTGVKHARFFDTQADAEAFANGISMTGTPVTVSTAVTPEAAEKAKALRNKAGDNRQSAQDSFDRCDTDGFLSQWASGICAQRDDHAADVAELGGLWTFPALFDLNGKLVAAKLIQTAYGLRWGVLQTDDPNSSVVKWLAFAPARKSTLEKHGFREGTVLAPAYADIRGDKTAYAGIFRKGPQFRRDVEIVDDGRE